MLVNICWMPSSRFRGIRTWARRSIKKCHQTHVTLMQTQAGERREMPVVEVDRRWRSSTGGVSALKPVITVPSRINTNLCRLFNTTGTLGFTLSKHWYPCHTPHYICCICHTWIPQRDTYQLYWGKCKSSHLFTHESTQTSLPWRVSPSEIRRWPAYTRHILAFCISKHENMEIWHVWIIWHSIYISKIKRFFVEDI